MTQQINLTLSDLSVDEVNYILAGLQELPAKLSNPLTQKIREQAVSQIAATETPVID